MSNDINAKYKALMAELAILKAEKAKGELKVIFIVNGRRLTAKLAEKGGMSVYGLQRTPVTLYREQWLDLLAGSDQLIKFLNDNADRFSTKADKDKTEAA